MYAVSAYTLWHIIQFLTQGGIRITIEPKATYTVKNQTAFMYCQATYDYDRYDMIYIWRFNGHVIDIQNDPFYTLVSVL